MRLIFLQNLDRQRKREGYEVKYHQLYPKRKSAFYKDCEAIGWNGIYIIYQI